jgi:hypothetical protein
VIQRQALDSSGQAVSKEGHQQTLDRLQCGNLLLQGGDLRRVLRLYGLNAFRGMALQIRSECILEYEARLVVFQG